ncbi:SpoIVB peptidase [Clostridium sp.]|uniref:SpoIVB peptidase n=1 Tax=Clostridium sp. TaxID=1506 RepID=UPI002FCA274B
MMRKSKNILYWILIPILLFIFSNYDFIKHTPTITKLKKINEVIELNSKSDNKDSLETSQGSFTSGNLAYTKASDIMVYPGGQPVGIKLSTKGALVIALSDIETMNNKVQSPASLSGIQIGDSVLEINDVNIKSSEDIATLVNRSNGKDVNVTVSRKGEILNFKVSPVLSKNDDKYKIGLWVRDSTAGVGTLTFYDPKTKGFAALGHPITDVDTGDIMEVENGEVIASNIVSVRKGVKGNPGELRGIFINEQQSLGIIKNNTECGIFGVGNEALINKKFNKPMKVALKNEVKVGKAQILTTVEGNEPKLYDIVIERLLPQETPGSKSMIIKIIDPAFVEITGGIVQGMSGSPIIQNNKLVGAVTHVLINKPDTGYGIYMDWMLQDAEILKNNY